MSDSTAAAENKITKLCERVGVTPDGKAYLDNALDPFKDEMVRCEGLPDLMTGNSVVREVKQTVTIAAPGSVNWSAHIFMDPLVGPYTGYDTTQRSQFSWDPTTQVNPKNFGGLTVRSGPDGVNLTPTDTTLSLPLPIGFANAKTRVLGMAFEVHDTTAAVSKQGTVIVYRKNSQLHKNQAINSWINPAVLTQRGSDVVLNLAGPPVNPADCLILPGSKQWEAKDGCYCVCTASDQNNNPSGSNLMATFQNDTKLAAGHGWISPLLTIDAANSNIFAPFGNGVMATPFNYSGAYFTGLNPVSTLTLNANWIIETFPDETDVGIIPIATPSPAFDPAALELYARIAHKLSSGVKVGSNASGDWIKNLANLMGTIGVPGMPLVNMGVDAYNAFMASGSKTPNPGLISFTGNTWQQRPQKTKLTPIPPMASQKQALEAEIQRRVNQQLQVQLPPQQQRGRSRTPRPKRVPINTNTK